MPRPKKKQITANHESILALMQEIYNECVEQRNTAIRIQNKMLGFMNEPQDLQLLGPVIKEQQKIIDSVIEKKIQLSKLQASLFLKDSNKDGSIASLSLDDKEVLNSILNKESAESNNPDSTKYEI